MSQGSLLVEQSTFYAAGSPSLSPFLVALLWSRERVRSYLLPSATSMVSGRTQWLPT